MRGRSVAFFIRGNDLFFSSDRETARQVVERLRGGLVLRTLFPEPGERPQWA